MIHYKRLFLLLSAAVVFGCTDNNSDEMISRSEYKISFLAKADTKDSRTEIHAENEAYGEVYWVENDELSLFCSGITSDGGLMFKAKSSGAETDIEYTSADPVQIADEYFGLYPYNQSASFDGSSILSTAIPVNQTAVYGSFDPNALLTAGRSTNVTSSENVITGQMSFYNLCGGFRLSLSKYGISKVEFSSNGSEPIAGDIKVSFPGQDPVPSVTANEGGTLSNTITLIPPQGVFSNNTYYYICMMPQQLSQGFTIKFYQQGYSDPMYVCEFTTPVTVSRGSFWTIDNADNPALFGKDLGESGTANCYILSKAGSYKFPIVTGNMSFKPYSKATSAVVVWETLNTDKAPKKGTLISDVSVDAEGDYVFFSTPDDVQDGNALIAVKDSEDNILWSWHIWICKGYDPDVTKQRVRGGTGVFMDRNLGALSADPYDFKLSNGLLYQWGRKDPFMGAVDRSDPTAGAMISTDIETTMTSNDIVGTIEYAVAHPNTFIIYRQLPRDWMFDYRDNTLWSDQKSMYDPCPVGWKVPDGRYDGVWAVDENFKTADDKVFGGYIEAENGRIFFPAAGFKDYENAALSGIKVVGYNWTSTTDSQTANCSYISFAYNDMKFYNYSTGWGRAHGFSVRCVKE